MNNIQIILKKYLQQFTNLLQEKRLLSFLLLITSIILLIWSILWPGQSRIKYFLVVLFYISFVIQCVLLIRKNYAIFLFRLLLIILLCFEIIFGILNKEITFYEEVFKMPDSKLGWRVIPNCNEKRVIKIIGRDTIYDVCYSSDEYGRRIGPQHFPSETVRESDVIKKHAVFLGCSFTFGEGLNDTATFPFLFEYFNPDYKSLNYGVPGYGPHQICLLFDEGINTINKRTIPGDSGFCIYTYIDDHMNRVFGSSIWLPFSDELLDIYVNDNKLVCKKRPYIQTHISLLLNNSETIKYFNITTSYPKTVKFYKRFAGIINYTARKYWSIKPHGDFYVGLYPYKYSVMDTSWIRFLDKKIRVLNIPPPADFETNSSYTIKNDGHPSKELNSYYIKKVSKLIVKTNKNINCI